MAQLKVYLPNEELKEVTEINLDELTPNELIDGFVSQGELPSLEKPNEYHMSKGGLVLSKDEQKKPLSEIGVKDGDVVTITRKSEGA